MRPWLWSHSPREDWALVISPGRGPVNTRSRSKVAAAPSTVLGAAVDDAVAATDGDAWDIG